MLKIHLFKMKLLHWSTEVHLLCFSLPTPIMASPFLSFHSRFSKSGVDFTVYLNKDHSFRVLVAEGGW